MAQKMRQFGTSGTILEAAFVDSAYQWPSPEGAGKNAIELQASVNIMLDDNESVVTTDTQKERMTIPENPALKKKSKWWNCCKSGDAAIMSLQEYELRKKAALRTRKKHYAAKKARAKELRMKQRYNRVPEGILIYRLDTADQTISLMSETHSLTVEETLCREITVTGARPSPDKTRRGMIVKGMVNGEEKEVTLVACEQRTSIAWLEAIDLMLANKERNASILQDVSCKIRLICALAIFFCFEIMCMNFGYGCRYLTFSLSFLVCRPTTKKNKRRREKRSTKTAGSKEIFPPKSSIKSKDSTSIWPVTPTNLFVPTKAPKRELREPPLVCITASKRTRNTRTNSKSSKRRRSRVSPSVVPSLRIHGTFTA